MIPYNDTYEDTLLNRNHRSHEEFPDVTAKKQLEEVRVKGKKFVSILRAARRNFLNVILQSFESISFLKGFLEARKCLK